MSTDNHERYSLKPAERHTLAMMAFHLRSTQATMSHQTKECENYTRSLIVERGLSLDDGWMLSPEMDAVIGKEEFERIVHERQTANAPQQSKVSVAQPGDINKVAKQAAAASGLKVVS